MNRVNEIKNLLRKYSFKGKNAKNDAMYTKILNNMTIANEKFVYVKVPDVRNLSKQFYDLNLAEIDQLLQSEYNEERLLALIIMVNQYKNNKDARNDLFELYLKNMDHINNWNLIDSSAQYIIGPHLFNKLSDRDQLLNKLVKSEKFWQRRIAVISSWHFIKNNQYDLTVNLIEALLKDQHHLVQKAAGWMLREIGKKDQSTLTKFLDEHASEMPRIMLRYSIEKLTSTERKHYLSL